MKLRELLCGEILDNVLGDTEITTISRNENSCKDALLFCLVGKSFDKNVFTELAEKNGARLIVTDTDLNGSDLPVIKVKNVRKAYAYAVAAFCGNPQNDITFYGITGTNGKTSTSYFLHSILNHCSVKNALIGTNGVIFNNEKIPFPPENSGISQMTTPDPEFLFPLLKHLLSVGINTVVMEVSSHALALFKVDPLRFKASIFTNFSHEHLDFHGSAEEYLRAKLRLCDLSDKVLYNANDITLVKTFEKKGAVSFGIEKGSYSACCVRHKGVNGVSYFLKHEKSVFRIESRICGTFTAQNTLAALTLALEEGLGAEVLCDAILSIPYIPGRLEKLLIDKTRFPFSVMIDYAHTPKSFEELLSSDVFKTRKGRLVALFGCGGDRDTEKRALMGKIAERYCDKIYITNDNPRGEDPNRIISDILMGINEVCKTVVIPDRKEAITAAFDQLEKDDILLLVGKGNENYLVDKEGRHAFSERDIVYALADVKRKEKQ